MRKSFFLMTFLFFLSLTQLFAQFRNPLDIPMYLSGSFAELRSNHFHSGLDIKTQGVEGFPVFAVADAWVSRIKISPWGYGNALYITHSNGYTSVYAHLSRYNHLIQNYVEDLEYKKKSFAIDCVLPKGEIMVKKGDTIAFTGNTGSSGGPHLHFELRKTNTQKPINPLRFPFDIEDTIPPEFKYLYVFDGNGIRKFDVDFVKNIYTIADTIAVFNVFDFGIVTHDISNGSENPLGINKIELYENGKLYYGYDNQSFSFAESRYINSHIWYGEYKKEGIRVQKLWKDPGNKLSVYTLPKLRGTIFKDKEIVSVLIKIFDVKGNSASLQFYARENFVKESANRFLIKNKNEVLMPYNIANHYLKNNLTIDIPKGALYDTIVFDCQFIKDSSYLGNVIYKLNTDSIPLQKKINVKLKLPDDLKKWAKNLLFVRLSSNNKKRAVTTFIRNGEAQMKVRDFGNYILDVDTIPPKIQEVAYQKELLSSSVIKFKITDNLSGIDKYEGLIDGNWSLFKYDPKQNLLYYQVDTRLQKKNTKHSLELRVSDAVGNVSVWKGSFFY